MNRFVIYGYKFQINVKETVKTKRSDLLPGLKSGLMLPKQRQQFCELLLTEMHAHTGTW